jgi:hypothetical protein
VRTGTILVTLFIFFGVAFLLNGSGGRDDDGGGNDELDGVYWQGPLPPPFQERADRFREAWNDCRIGDLRPFMLPRRRAQYMPALRRALRRRGWATERPRIGTPKIDTSRRTSASSGDVQYLKYAAYPLLTRDAGNWISTVWIPHDGQWCWLPDQDTLPRLDLLQR